MDNIDRAPGRAADLLGQIENAPRDPLIFMVSRSRVAARGAGDRGCGVLDIGEVSRLRAVAEDDELPAG